MKKLTSTIILLLVFSLLLVSLPEIGMVKAEGTIYIRADGTVEGTDKIQRDGNVYTFTDDICDSIIVEKDDVVIDGAGYSLQGAGSGTGMSLTSRSSVTIKNIEIKAFSNGISLNSSSNKNNIISRNNITNNRFGIRFWLASNNTISGNNITKNDYGIYLESSSNNNINDNNVTSNDYGIFLFDVHTNVLRNNRMENNNCNFNIVADFVNDIDASNTVDGKPIYYWVEEQDKTVPSDAGYVALTRCTNITVQNLNLTNNWQGIRLASTTDSTITRNIIKDNDAGIILWDSLNNTVFQNVIANNGIGIRIDGIFPVYSQNNRIYGNNITNNDVGIYLWDSSNNTIYRNHIANNGCGIQIIGLGGEAANNLIHHNNFINNTADVPGHWHTIVFQEVWVPPQRNVWDDGKEGNYWSNYHGVDNDGNGIWDTPYVISENNQDNYPLMNQFQIQWNTPTEKTEPFSTTWILVIIGIIAIVGVALLVFYTKTKKTMGEVK